MVSELTRRACQLSLLGLAACTGPDGSMLGLNHPDNFGEANRQTFAAQVIDPAPAYDELYLGENGDKAAQAIERYRTDKVKKPEGQRLTEIGKAQSGSSNGGDSSKSGD